MRIRGKPTDTHTTPLHARGGRYTRRSGGGSAIAAAARSLHLSTRGFAAREARQPAPASCQECGGDARSGGATTSKQRAQAARTGQR